MPANNQFKLAISATLHCLTGCAIGEVTGMVLGMTLHWSDGLTVLAAVVLAFSFGYLLTSLPLLRAGLTLGTVAKVALAADTVSIAVMEITDNAVMLLVPGAMDGGLMNPVFWLALPLSLAAGFVMAVPVNLYLLSRGKGHAVVHQYHGHGEHLDH